MELNYIYKFDMSTLFSKRVSNGILKCSPLICERARSIVSKRDSLLIDQIRQIKSDESKLEEILCILDFSGFIKYHKMTDLLNVNEIELNIHLLDKGLETKKELTIYVRDFLKSNSMSKDCQIYYINSRILSKNGKNLYEEMVPRVFFDFHKRKTVLSKLYSYSGTICSDCNLLDDIRLNDGEVVVVKDKNSIVTADCITMISPEFLYGELKKIKGYFNKHPNSSLEEILEFNACLEFDSLYKSLDDPQNEISSKTREIIDKYNELPKNDIAKFKKGLNSLIEFYSEIYADNDNQVKWERIVAKNYPFDLNVFDGEGLISKEFCEEIRTSLCHKLGNKKYKDSTSFQIRLPYVKGMVHSCDLKYFFEEKGVRFVEHTIYSGTKKYDINNIKMILTESQFKLDGFIKDNGSDEIKDLSDYIKLINKYNYSFGVIDANKEEKSTCSLEYQFISTLPLNKDDITNIYKDVKFNINDECSKEKIIQSLKEEDTLSSNEELRMYNLNPTFYFSTQRYSSRKHKVFSRLKEKALFSKFNVHGSRRYLSSNLLELLYHISFEDYKAYQDNEWLYINQFYMPTHLNHNNYAVFLRSPHYSRNEIVFLNRRPFILQKELEKYFSHLTGVVMINPRSLSADRLGGADFDGDTVLVVNDKNIVTPVTRDLVSYVDKDINYKYLPCKIPSLKGRSMNYTKYEDRLRCLQDTFSSRVGILSNEAISRAASVYSVSDINAHNKMAEYTILNGLEIDSAKTGKKPEIEFMKNEDKDSLLSEFLYYKKAYDDTNQTIGVKRFINDLPSDVFNNNIWYDESDSFNYGYNVLSIMCNMSSIKLFKDEECKKYTIETAEPKDYVKTLALALIYSNFNKLVRKVFTAYAKKIYNDRINRIYEQLEYICNKNGINLEMILDKLNLDNLEAFELISKYVNDNTFHFLTNQKERKEYINRLLGINDDYLSESLSNFDNDGFRLLFLVLHYFANRITTIRLSTSVSEKEHIEDKIYSLSEDEQVRFKRLYAEYEGKINEIISKNEKLSDDQIRIKIIEYLKGEAKSLSIADVNSAINICSSNMVFDVFFDIIKEYMEVSNGQ